MMKHLNKYLSLALALVLCLSLAACGESNEDYGDDGSDYNLYGVPDSFEGLVKVPSSATCRAPTSSNQLR